MNEIDKYATLIAPGKSARNARRRIELKIPEEINLTSPFQDLEYHLSELKKEWEKIFKLKNWKAMAKKIMDHHNQNKRFFLDKELRVLESQIESEEVSESDVQIEYNLLLNAQAERTSILRAEKEKIKERDRKKNEERNSLKEKTLREIAAARSELGKARFHKPANLMNSADKRDKAAVESKIRALEAKLKRI